MKRIFLSCFLLLFSCASIDLLNRENVLKKYNKDLIGTWYLANNSENLRKRISILSFSKDLNLIFDKNQILDFCSSIYSYHNPNRNCPTYGSFTNMKILSLDKKNEIMKVLIFHENKNRYFKNNLTKSPDSYMLTLVKKEEKKKRREREKTIKLAENITEAIDRIGWDLFTSEESDKVAIYIDSKCSEKQTIKDLETTLYLCQKISLAGCYSDKEHKRIFNQYAMDICFKNKLRVYCNKCEIKLKKSKSQFKSF